MTGSDKKHNEVVPIEEPPKKEPDIDNDQIDALLENLPKNMPPEVKRSIRMSMMGTSFGGPPSHPLFDKFTPDHVTQYLDGIQKDDDNLFKLTSSNRWFFLFYVVLIVGVFCFLVVYLLPRDKALLELIFKLFMTFAGGFGSGYGLKAYKDRNK